MLCPACKTELRVSASKYVYKDGHLYMAQELTCRNPKCENDGVMVDRVWHELELSEDYGVPNV